MNFDKKENENKENESINERKLTECDMIEESGGVVAKNKDETIHCLSIIGQIEGHYILPEGQKATKYEHILPMLVSIEQDEDIDGVLILLNTMGGDVEAGLAIAEVIASMKKPTVSVVLGGGHSIGVPLAVSGKKSFIVPSATMTIHPVRINGLVVGVPQTFTYFQEMQKRIIDFICAHSRAEKDKIYELMMRPDMMATDVGSIIEGREAVEYGIIDEVGGVDKALEALRGMIRRKGKNKLEFSGAEYRNEIRACGRNPSGWIKSLYDEIRLCADEGRRILFHPLFCRGFHLNGVKI